MIFRNKVTWLVDTSSVHLYCSSTAFQPIRLLVLFKLYKYKQLIKLLLIHTSTERQRILNCSISALYDYLRFLFGEEISFVTLQLYFSSTRRLFPSQFCMRRKLKILECFLARNVCVHSWKTKKKKQESEELCQEHLLLLTSNKKNVKVPMKRKLSLSSLKENLK